MMILLIKMDRTQIKIRLVHSNKMCNKVISPIQKKMLKEALKQI